MPGDDVATLTALACKQARSARTASDYGEDQMADEILADAIALAEIADRIAIRRGTSDHYPDLPGVDDLRALATGGEL